MIIDRLFSQFTKRTLSASISERIASAKRIKHLTYAFEKLKDGTYNVAPKKWAGFNMIGVLFFKLELEPIDGKYALITKMRFIPKIYVLIIEILALVYAVLSIIEGKWVFLLLIPFIVLITVMLFSLFRYFFVDFDYDMRWAEFVDDKQIFVLVIFHLLALY